MSSFGPENILFYDSLAQKEMLVAKENSEIWFFFTFYIMLLLLPKVF
jgi:hypothetical protein